MCLRVSYEKKNSFASSKSLNKGVESGVGSGSTNPRCGSDDPDPHQNVTDLQHWTFLIWDLESVLLSLYFVYGIRIRVLLLHRQELQVSLIRSTVQGSILFDIRPLGTMYDVSMFFDMALADRWSFFCSYEYKTAGFFSPYCK
jgi:hypothetical protein